MPATTKLGDHIVPVPAQKHAYLRRKLGKDGIGKLLSGNLSLESYGHDAYQLLAILIPAYTKAVPEYEFEGYASREAMEADEYDEEQDKSPTFDEILGALEVAIKANGGERLGKLLALVESVQDLSRTAPRPSSSSPSASGGSDSMSSSTRPPTSTPSEG